MIYLSSMQRALVTEDAAFIGSHVTAALLRAGFRVCRLDNLWVRAQPPPKIGSKPATRS